MTRLCPTRRRSCSFTCAILLISVPCIASLSFTRCSVNRFSHQSHLWKHISVQPPSIWNLKYSGGSSDRFSVTERGNTRYSPARRCGYISTSSLLSQNLGVDSAVPDDNSNDKIESHRHHTPTSTVSRRKTLTHLTAAAMLVCFPFGLTDNLAMADVGTLPELKGATAVLQGITVSVADVSQQNSMIKFLVEGFLFNVLRQRTVGTVTDTVRTHLRMDGRLRKHVTAHYGNLGSFFVFFLFSCFPKYYYFAFSNSG